MEWIPALLGGLGLGALFKSLLDAYISRRAALSVRLYQEKRECYLGILATIAKAALETSANTANEYGLMLARCRLFGSDDVNRFAEMIVTTAPHSSERGTAYDSLLRAMRDDLMQK